jgi:capsular exopolysaccharide synthesis family protein
MGELSSRLQDLNMAEATGIVAQIIEPAYVPKEPVKYRRARNILMGGLVGIMSGIGLAILLEYLNDKIYTADDAKISSGLSLLGIIPSFEEDKNHPTSLLVMNKPKAVPYEAFKILRTNLEHIGLGTELKKILFTSSLPEEGKSTVAANLAVATAMLGKKTLVIDADIREPFLHEVFELENEEGIFSVLGKKATLKEAIQKTSVENLFVLTSGPIPANAVELYDSVKTKHVIESAGEEFEVVILDAAPIIPVPDALILANYMDGVILVMGCGTLTHRALARAKEEWELNKVNIIGGILTKAHEAELEYFGRYGIKGREEEKTA